MRGIIDLGPKELLRRLGSPICNDHRVPLEARINPGEVSLVCRLCVQEELARPVSA